MYILRLYYANYTRLTCTLATGGGTTLRLKTARLYTRTALFGRGMRLYLLALLAGIASRALAARLILHAPNLQSAVKYFTI